MSDVEANLVGVGGPDSVSGYASDPQYVAWQRLAPQGALVTTAQRNAVVAQLSWARSILAKPPSSVARLADGTPFPFGVSLDGALVLGAADGEYLPGDVVFPAAASAGAAAATGGATVVGASFTVPDATRRAAFDACDGALRLLELQPGQLVLVRDETAPGGWIWGVAAIAVIGVAIYAAYSAYVDGEAVKAGAATQQVRIREEAHTAQVVAQTNAQTNALAQRLAFAQQTGTLPPPSPIENTPIQIPVSDTAPPSTAPSPLGLLWYPAVGVLGAAGIGAWAKWREYRVRKAVKTLGLT